MRTFTPNKFISNLAAVCAEHLLAEKWLLAPNRRVGNQWVEQVARTGQPAVNLRVTTLRSLVMEISGPVPGKLISARGAEILVSRVLKELRKKAPRYFTTLEPFPSLVSALTRSLDDLRAAGVAPGSLRESGKRGNGETGKNQNLKMEELADLLAGYDDGLRRAGLVDYGDLLSGVIERFRNGSDRWPEGALLLAPDDLEPRGQERALLELIPVQVVGGLVPRKPDSPGGTGAGDLTDLARLAWMDMPSQAPPPLGDGTLEIVGAVGEVNEARLALRKCLAGSWPLDQVEILYTDRSTYLPLLFELFARHFPFETGDLDNLPATFSEGIPSIYSRPGKALGAWAQWALDGYPVQGLAGMVREGLLILMDPTGENSQASRAAAADVLFGLGAIHGPVAALAAVKGLLDRQAREHRELYDENGDERTAWRPDPSVIESLHTLLSSLEKCTPLPGHTMLQVLEGAACFLKTVVRRAGEFDEYAAKALALDIDGTIDTIGRFGHFPDGDPLQWIVSFIHDVRVAGSGPRPGRLHVAPLAVGGHSGRPHTVVLGLDDGRFPGSDRQEPILLDSEREALSPLLRVSSEDLRTRERSLASLAERIRGTLALVCCVRNLVEERDTFPSPSLVKAYRILADPNADQEALLAHLSPPAGPVDPGSGTSLDSAEWWTERFTADVKLTGGNDALKRLFPDLANGMRAGAHRLGLDLTPWEGLTGCPPPGLDILSATGPAVSSNRLQTLGSCPLRYFFKYILEIESIEEEPPEPGKWLTPADKGSLLHELFHVYMNGLIREGRAPDYDRDINGLEQLLDGLLDRQERSSPPPSSHVRDHERRQMMESARIFLREEELFARDHEPLYAEASLGLPPTDLPTKLDREEPVSLTLAAGCAVRVRGRVDRIDRRRADGSYVITDYKSGSNWLYTRKDPFHQGRVVQHLLYTLMVEKCLEISGNPGARVEAFRFLFPTSQAQGEAVHHTREALDDGRDLLVSLCRIAGEGRFAPTDDDGDCRYCDYAPACGDTVSQARRMAARLAGGDPALDPMRKVRGYE